MNTATVNIDSTLYSDARTDPEAFVLRRMRETSSWTNNSLLEEPSENVTRLHDRPPELAENFRCQFISAKDEIFEDGMESEFSKDLMGLIKKYGNDAIAELAYFIVYEKGSAEVTAEALRWLGMLDDPSTYIFRRWLLETSLRSSSLWIRDGAALGLSFMDDLHAIPFLKAAITIEAVDEIRRSLQQVLDQLESTEQCPRC